MLANWLIIGVDENLKQKRRVIYIYIYRERERESKFSLVDKKTNITSYILVKQKEILSLGSFRKEQDKKDFFLKLIIKYIHMGKILCYK